MSSLSPKPYRIVWRSGITKSLVVTECAETLEEAIYRLGVDHGYDQRMDEQWGFVEPSPRCWIEAYSPLERDWKKVELDFIE